MSPLFQASDPDSATSRGRKRTDDSTSLFMRVGTFPQSPSRSPYCDINQVWVTCCPMLQPISTQEALSGLEKQRALWRSVVSLARSGVLWERRMEESLITWATSSICYSCPASMPSF